MYECYSVQIMQGLSDQNAFCFFQSKLLEQTPLLVAGDVTNEGASPGETIRLILSLKRDSCWQINLKYSWEICKTRQLFRDVKVMDL